VPAIGAASGGVTPTPSAGAAERKAQARWWSARPVWIAAAAVAAGALFAGGTITGVTLTNRPAATQQASELAAIVAASDVQRESAPIAGGGTATVVASADLGRSALLANDLPPAPDGKTYQLWYITGGNPTSAGLMSGSHASGEWTVLDGRYSPGSTIGMTVEPAGGSKRPTTKPIVAIGG
jgi:hypothetical protein